MTHAEMEGVVHRYVAGFAAGDAGALTELFADDASLEDPVGSEPTVGRAAIAAHFRAAAASGSKIELAGPVRTAGDHAAFAFSARVGEDTRIHVIDVFRFDDTGKVVEMRAYWGPDNIERTSSAT